uniref:GTP cyclohydrolase 1 type 2 homolog n=1 Tax=Cyanothece sp. (strain PCC 7425 / ATCC 29141) TaxID=395961 RepID=B8HNU2_CYAP4
MLLSELATWLNDYLQVNRFGQDCNGIYRNSNRPICRLGLALQPGPTLLDWIQTQQLDALLLHRPWGLDLDSLPQDLGVLAYHLAFDEQLTLGFNPPLAIVLGMTDLEALGEKEGRVIGMLGNILPQTFESYCQRVIKAFGGYETMRQGQGDWLRRVAVVGAMTSALVQQAADRGVDLYLTGQLRQPALATLESSGLGLLTIGHHRSEVWGLHCLQQILCKHYPELQVWVRESLG